MPLPPRTDTIAAVATAPGVGAIGIVRVSGPRSLAIADAMFNANGGRKASAIKPARATFGKIVAEGGLVDEAVMLSFHAPHSYTGQDLVEFQTHGGSAVLRRVLDLCLEHGARPAGPGEYTLRAFLNGRIDLAQAESVVGIVNATSERARRNAALGLERALSTALDAIQTDVTTVYGALQATLDYPDEGVPEAEILPPLDRAVAKIDALLATAEAGRFAREGATLAVLGRPNAGKSSLVNALLGFDRAIVGPAPGTTRDYLEAPLEVAGIPLTLIDTAGIRSTGDATEALGVDRSRQVAEAADLAVVVIDRSQPLTADDIELLASVDPTRRLVVASKADLDASWGPEQIAGGSIAVSTVTGEGLGQLREAMREALIGSVAGDELWITNERHIQALRSARVHFLSARELPDDVASTEIEDGLRALAHITGRGDIAEETLAYVFATFCVGK